jgi:hypothetical protein
MDLRVPQKAENLLKRPVILNFRKTLIIKINRPEI